MTSRALPIILACVVAGLAAGQDTRPTPLAPADKRPIPATIPEGRKLIADLDAERAALDRVQRDDPAPARARTIELLEEQIKTLKLLETDRQDLANRTVENGRAEAAIEEVRKKIGAAGHDEEPLPDPADPNAEANLEREKTAADELIQEATRRRDESAAAKVNLEVEKEGYLRRLPSARRALSEAQTDLTDYETDSRAAAAGGIPPDQARIMNEQVWLYRLRLAERQAALDLLRYQASDLPDTLIDLRSFETGYYEDKLLRAQERRARIDLLSERAASARVERGLAAQSAVAKLAVEAPEWARPYWELKAKLSGIEIEIADLARKKRAVELKVAGAGEIRTLSEDAAAESRSFANVDAGRATIDDVVPSTTSGLLQFIARREKELERVQSLQAEVRTLRKEVRERQRAVRAEDGGSISDEVEAARKRSVPPEGAEAGTPAEREAASPSSWQSLKKGLGAAHATRAKALEEYDALLGSAGESLHVAYGWREKGLLKYRSALLWTRDPSEISIESLDRARADLTSAPEGVARAGGNAASSAWTWIKDAARERRWRQLVVTIGSLLVFAALVTAVHRRVKKAYAAGTDPLTLGRAAQIGMTLLRNVEVTALVAFAGIAVPAIAGAPPRVLAVCAAVFGPPFVFRLARTLIDLLFGATPAERGLLGLPEGPAGVLKRTCVLLLRVCAVFVPLAILLGVTGYKDENPGFVELLWLLASVCSYLVVLVVLLRPSGIGTLLRRKGGGGSRAAMFRAIVTAAYPLVIAAVIFLLVLRSLSYRVAVRFFLERFLITAAWVTGAIVVRRWFTRILLGNEPKVAMPPPELASDPQRYEAQGRRALFDRLRRLALTLVVFGPALFFILDAWGLTGAGWDAVFNRPLKPLSETLTLGDVVNATVTAVLAFFLVRSARDLLRFVILPRTSLDVGVRYTIVTLTTYALVALSAIVILGGQLRVDPAVIGGFVAALGIGLGFGLQEIINNFFSGIILLVERPLKVGDTVSVAGTTGRVDRINMRSTTIMTAENTGVIVPNKDLISSTVTNWSAGTPTIREMIPLGIAYGSDTAQFKKVAMEAVESHGLVLKHPPPEIVFTGFGASSMDFQLRYWLKLGTSGSRVKSDLYFALEAGFRRHGIEMPFPQQDIHVRTWNAKPPADPALAERDGDDERAAGNVS